jgi:hypothetical protein
LSGLDAEGREALLRYVLRPPIAQERVEQQPDGLVRITLKKAYADGTVAVDMDPLSLLRRLATSVPLPRFHTIHYAGVAQGQAARYSPRRVHGARVSAQSPLGGRRLLPPTAEDVREACPWGTSPRRGYVRAATARGLNSSPARSR